MRVIAGKYKSRKLKTLAGKHTRPTADKLKGAIFSSIAFEVKYGQMLDLFSGSGAMGIEAISRGFDYAYFNDNSKEAISVIKKNIKELKLEAKSKVFNFDYQQALKVVSKNKKIDFIFIDPPYDKIDITNVFDNINKYDILSEKGLVCVETSNKQVLLDKYHDLIKYKEKNYKATTIAYYRKEE